MTFRGLLLPILAILALAISACSPSPEPEPTPDIDAIVAATVSAQRQAFLQPILAAPPDGAIFASPADVTLRWDWVRDLGENEHFDLRVWRAGDPDYGITWTDDQIFNLSDWLSQREPGQYFWSVAAIAGQDGTLERVIAEAPAPRSFTIESVELPPTPTPTPPPELQVEDIVSLPEGFAAQIFGQLPEARTAVTDITFDDDGTLLALAIDGRIWRFEDADGDGEAETTTQILFNDGRNDFTFEWLVGIAIYEGKYYVSDSGRIGYLEDMDGDGVLDQYTLIIDELPSRLYPLHSNNGIEFDADGKLYVGIGSTTDHGPLQHEYESSILRMNPDGSDMEVYATGFRNPYDIEITADGRMFTGDNGPDALDNVMPFYPPEELNYVREGRDYGFPDAYGKNRTIRPVSRPIEAAVTELITSSVTSGIAHYDSGSFPEAYHDSVFVAQFGGFNRQGRKIVVVPLEPTDDGGYTGEFETFATYLNDNTALDVTVGPDGALYATEWNKGLILRIDYIGNAEE